MLLARRALAGLAWLYVLGVAIQFLLAGIGSPQLGGESMDAHEAVGYSALHVTPILFIVLAVVGKSSRSLLILTVVFAVIAFVQPFWATEFQGEFLASLHVLGALVIFVLAHSLARMATREMRGAPAEA